MSINDLNTRIGRLSPAKRKLLEQKLKQKNSKTNDYQGIPLRKRTETPSLSFSQTRMWLLDQLNPGNPAYNRPSNLQLLGKLNVAALEQSLNEIVHRHQVLRTSFPAKNGQPVQEIAPNLRVTLPVVNLSHLSSEARNHEVQKLAVEEAQRPFELSQLPLIRATLLKLEQKEHILLLTMHHIIFDGWSMGVLLQELTKIYQAFSQKKRSPLPELAIQYADFAYWQRQRLQGKKLESQLDYWKQELKGNLPVLELPTDRPRAAIQTHNGAREYLLLPENLSVSLLALSKQERVTLFMTLLAAFQVLLYRYTGQEDIIVGSPVAGRESLETEQLIGVFINTIVLRSRLEKDLTFQQLLQKVKETALAAYANQNLPFEKLIEELRPERDWSHTPLFQVLFQLRSHVRETWKVADLTVRDFQRDMGIAQFDLSLDMVEGAAGLSCVFQYNSDLFDSSTIKCMAGNFQTLLEGIVAHPEQNIAKLPILTEAERYQILKWNDTRVDYPQQKCIHQLFEEQVTRTPDEVAVVFGERQLTYRELNQRANQLAHYLQKLGVKPETLVGICLERSHLMVIGLLGILKSGSTYVPLDPNYPAHRLALMVEDSQLSILLTEKESAQIIPNYSGIEINLDTDWSTGESNPPFIPPNRGDRGGFKITLESSENLRIQITSQNLAYIIYTSGSTGKPKGVQINHQGVVNFLTSMAREPGIASDDVLLAVTSISFDIAVLELFLPLTVGAKVIIASQSDTNNVIQLLKLISQAGVTMMQATPVTWKMLQAGKWEQIQPLKMLCGGEAMSEELAAWMLQQCSSLWNVYGPTEATIWATLHQVRPHQKPIPIGHPLANTRIKILDTCGQLVPIGVSGEIHIGGVQLARGYLNRPQLTREKFISIPPAPLVKGGAGSGGIKGDSLYKTGDLGRYLSDGSIECLGRLDNQVKIRGFRIELGEIEGNLMLHPEINNCVVTAREDITGDKRLVACMVPCGESTPKNEDLRSFLRQKLPGYMIPSHFVFLEQFPLTPNGKIDRQALPAPDLQQLTPVERFVPPRNQTEQHLSNIWSRLLNLEPISIDDNFFDLGGHSLLAIKLFAAIEEQWGQKLPLNTLFDTPTIRQLGKLLNKSEVSNADTPWDSLVLLRSGVKKEAFFLVHDADGDTMLYLNLARHLHPERSVYGLRPYGKEGFPILHHTIKQMVNHYIERILSIQPQGPYHLGGLCDGGIYAYEIAQQLQARGHRVGLVALLDASDYEAVRRKNSENVRYISDRPKYELYSRLLARGGKLPNLLKDRISVRMMLRLTREGYVPQKFQGKLHLFRATATEYPIDETPLYAKIDDPLFGWQQRATEGVVVYDIADTHSGILREPSVKLLASYIETALAQWDSTKVL